MDIEIIAHDKKRFLDLLLLADEQENMIDKYLERGDLFALYDGHIKNTKGPRSLKSVCVVTPEGDSACELKNIATYPEFQGQGYGKALVEHICAHYKGRYRTLLVGTGESPRILRFYKRCGFENSHRVPNFFTDNYDHPIFECGVQLVDMIYLKKNL